MKKTWCSAPSSRARRRQGSVSGPSPTRVSVASGSWGRTCVAKMRMIRSGDFSRVCRPARTRRAAAPRKDSRASRSGVRVQAEGLIEHVRHLHGARDDVDRRGDASLTPVGAEPFAQDHEAVALVVDVREDPLERPLQRQVQPGLEHVVLGEFFGGEERRKPATRCVVFTQRRRRTPIISRSHCTPELQEQHRRRLREADVEVPSRRVEHPRREWQRDVHPRVRPQRQAGEGDRAGGELVGAGFRIMGSDDCDLVTTPS